MFGTIKRILAATAVRKFYKENPGWGNARTRSEIGSFFARHPVWQHVSADLREELSGRLASASDHFKSFDADHALEVVAMMTELFDVLRQNIQPIDRKRDRTTADKLWLISETFRKLGSKGLREVIQAGEAIDDQTAVHALTSSTLCLEAAVCVDHYKIDAMPLMALAWVYRSKDFAKAEQVLAEAEKWVPILPDQEFHSIGGFDQAQMNDTAAMQEGITRVREDIDRIHTHVKSLAA